MTDYESGPSYGQFVNPETGSPGDDAKPKKPQKKPQKKVSRKMRRKLTFTAPKRKSKCNELPCNILGGRRSRKRGRKRWGGGRFYDSWEAGPPDPAQILI